jgi:hypothetical protein
MIIRLALLVIFVLSVTPIVPSAAAGADRFALVIGNAKYLDGEAPLKAPINDARDIAEELKRDGFNVEVGENLTGDAMRRAFERLYGRIKPGSVALIFFSGFGVQSNRQSYMIPVDAQIWTEADVRRDGFSLETVLGEINSRGAGVKIALIDASRRNPFERRFRSFSAGLAPVIAPNGTLVMYSAAPSSVISDNGRDHSLFVQELLKEIRVPDLMAEETLNRTRVGVTRASRSEQVPWISSSLAEDFSFIPGAGGPRPAAPGPVATVTQAPEPPPPPRVDPLPRAEPPPSSTQPARKPAAPQTSVPTRPAVPAPGLPGPSPVPQLSTQPEKPTKPASPINTSAYWNTWFDSGTGPALNILIANNTYTYSLDLSAFNYAELRGNAQSSGVKADRAFDDVISDLSVPEIILTIKPMIPEGSGLRVIDSAASYLMKVDLKKIREPDSAAAKQYADGSMLISELSKQVSAGTIQIPVFAESLKGAL